MSDMVSPLLQWLNAHPQLAGLVTFLISAGESVAILGTIVPGSIMMTAIGTLAGAGIIPLWSTIIWAILGAIVGDGISYWIGHYFKDRLPRLWPFRRYPYLLKTGETFFHKYGSMSVFIGRFVGPVRALVPLVAGMLGMKPLKFLIANVTSAIGWAPAYMLPGILLGAASLELPPDIALHFILGLFMAGLFIMLCLWFVYKLSRLISHQIDQIQDAIWRTLKHSRHFSKLTVLLKSNDPAATRGQLNLGIYALITFSLFLALVFYTLYLGPAQIAVNDAMYHLFRGLRTDRADTILLLFTLFGEKILVGIIAAFIAAWLFIKGNKRAAIHTVALIACIAVLIWVFKHVFQSPRPWGLVPFDSEKYSMPSGHTALATALFMWLAFLVSSGIRAGKRWPIYTLSLLLLFFISLSRLYLGAHWFTDVVASWLLGASVLLSVIISYQREPAPAIKPAPMFFSCFCFIVGTWVVAAYFFLNHMRTTYTPLSWPVITTTMRTWWTNGDDLSSYRVSLFGFPSRRINFEWVGNIDNIRQTLKSEGWSKPPARDVVSTLHRITNVSSGQYLPMISPQYLDKKPELILTRPTSDGKSLIVLRLWDANRVIQNKDSRTRIWVGIISKVSGSYSWIFQPNADIVEINPSLIFPNKKGIAPWQWKIIVIDEKLRHRTLEQKVMLIRHNKFAHKKE